MERGFSNPQEYADKNVRAPLDSELRALRVLRGENFFTGDSPVFSPEALATTALAYSQS